MKHLVIGIAVLLTAAIIERPEATLVGSNTLKLVCGGEDRYCAKNSDDPDPVHCDSCQSDGNGNYVKCNSTGKSQVNEYVENQFPVVMLTYNNTNCGGTAKKYSDSGCSSYIYGQNAPCLREYNAVTATTTNPPGVNCPVQNTKGGL